MRILWLLLAVAGPALAAGAKSRPPAKPAEPAAPVFDKDQKAMADFMAEMGKVAEAIAIYDDLLQAKPDDVELIDSFIPICRKSPECLPRVLGLLRDQVKLAPDDKDAVEDLFETLMKDKEVDQATKVLSAYLSRHPDDFPMRVSLVEAFQGVGRLDEALAELDRMPGHKDDAEVGLLRIDLLEALGRFPEVDEQIAALLQAHPDNAGGLARLGERALARGDVEAAAQALAKGRAQNSADPKDQERLDELDRQVAAARHELRVEDTVFRIEIELSDSEDDLEQRDDY